MRRAPCASARAHHASTGITAQGGADRFFTVTTAPSPYAGCDSLVKSRALLRRVSKRTQLCCAFSTGIFLIENALFHRKL